MKVLAFAATISSKSINKKLAGYAASLVPNASVELIDLNDFELPIYSDTKEEQLGQPANAKAFFEKIGEADAIVVSFAEHNGSYTAAYKNLFDWTSRIDQKVFQNKPMLMVSTSPGPGGAQNVLAAATTSAPYFAGDVKGSLSVPSFFDNFDSEHGRITNPELNESLQKLATLLG